MTENRYLPIPQQKVALHGTRVAMYIVGQEETAGESSVSVVAGVRTVTTNMISEARRQDAPRFSLPDELTESVNPQIQISASSVKLHLQL